MFIFILYVINNKTLFIVNLDYVEKQREIETG